MVHCLILKQDNFISISEMKECIIKHIVNWIATNRFRF